MNQCNSCHHNINSDVQEDHEILVSSPLVGLSEDMYLSTTGSNHSNNKYRARIKKKTGNICYTLNMLEQYGNIQLMQKDTKIYVAKLRKIDFDDNFDELFEKGKNNIGNYFKTSRFKIFSMVWLG